MLKFRTINVDRDRELVLTFRRDSFVVSFGNGNDFHEEEYLEWLKEKQNENSTNFVLVLEEEAYIGQLELSIRQYDEKYIGYVHLYYLIPDKRGKGLGSELNTYAENFFKRHGVSEYHLRVSPTNTSALSFYRKLGLTVIGEELDGKVIRMRGQVSG
ncbi:GNAT family N-acetyltransferase [Virgibacillus halodenitrificans]|uniref:GNAT family N-acetyltransferase n=1 Tax=Virgibacillus halodenitrificans TaxID=1482 RepID=A0AAC9NK06_VIRHA|nr:GNAT family N-acetyltransferase [Virgibacillus halodenitrificans]APC47543.1 GNAT family N-acetyltransferase [Virgibacillus halodenitrificans]CDQ32357.1 pseudaminic acid biosynthesis N-acetyl transferase [Virgibacillus halodenitrificans]